MKSKNVLKLLAMLFSLSAMVVFVGCDSGEEEEEQEPDPTQTLMEIVNTTEGFDSLKKYIEFYPDLVAALSGTGDYTFFAPDNNAFVGLLATPGFPEDIRSINPDIVKGVLSYHVSTTRYESADLTAGLSISTLVPNENIVINEDGTLKTGSSNPAIEITEADVKATNGVMHIIGSVMITPTVGATLTPILGTNAGTLLLGAPFSSLAYGIQQAEAFALSNSLPSVIGTLAGAATTTVFAPTNETFAAAAAQSEVTVEQFLGSLTGQQWYGMILNHVVIGSVAPADLTSTAAQTTGVTYESALVIDQASGTKNPLFFFYADAAKRNGIGLFIDSNREYATFNPVDPATYAIFNAEVVLPDAAVNGTSRVHVIAGLLSPN